MFLHFILGNIAGDLIFRKLMIILNGFIYLACLHWEIVQCDHGFFLQHFHCYTLWWGVSSV